MRIIIKRVAIILVLWMMLTGGAVFVCSSDTSGFFGGGSNRRPVAEDSFIQTRIGQSVTSTMRASDPDGDDLTYRVTSGPDVGSLSNINEDTGRFTYVPAAVGTDSFNFRANDGRLDSNTATVNIAVTATESGTVSAGLKSLLPDPAGADMPTVLWDAPSRDLQSALSAGSRLRSNLLEIAADFWQPHRMVGLDEDGGLVLSIDGGVEWERIAHLGGSEAERNLAISGDHILVALDSASCEEQVAADTSAMEGNSRLEVIQSCGIRAELDSLGGAWVLRDGWIRDARHDAPLLGPSVYMLAVDHWRQGRLVALKPTGEGQVGLWESNDGGGNWRLNNADIPAGLPTGLLISSVSDGLLYLAVWDPSGTSVHEWRPEHQGWEPIGIMNGSRAQLFHCGPGNPCLLSENGRRLMRFDDDANDEPTD